jgi:hypothetical protein
MSMPISERIAPCTETLDARDCLLDGAAKGRQAGLHFPVDFDDSAIKGVDLLQMKTKEKTMVPGHADAQGLAQSLV